MNFNVVIATHQRRALLEQTLSSLVVTCKPPGFERVIVIENGSNDGTQALCERYANKLALDYFNRPRSGSMDAAISTLDRSGFLCRGCDRRESVPRTKGPENFERRRLAMAIKSLCVLSLGLILTAGLAYGETGSRSDVRQAAGFLEAKATGVRLFTRENVGSRGADLENFKEEMLSERIPALRREIDTLQQTVRALKDGPEPALAGGVEIVVESCWNKWKKLLAADKYLFRAVVAVDPGIQISEMAIRDLENQDMDATRIPNAVDRSDGKAGVQYEIYDSFKAWGSKAELVVEDQGGHEYTRTFSCNDVKDAVFH